MDTNSYVIALAAVWGAAGLFLIARKQLSFGVLVFLAGALGAAALNDTVRPYALGVLPALGLHTVAAVATMPVPMGLGVLGTRRMIARIDRLLAHTVALAGLTGVVVAAYVVIVVGLGRVPSHRERTIIGLSMAAAAVSALLYLPTRDRLTNLANRIVYGERQAPDEVLRTFGSRLSR